MKEKLNILILEDSVYDAELIEYELRREGIDFISKIVETEETFNNALHQKEPDIILADHSLPSFDGITALAIVKKKYPEIPFFFVSGKIGEEFAVEMLKNGATDYIFKNNLSKLVPAIKRALEETREKAERRRAEESLLKAHVELEKNVKERTMELEEANHDLKMEISRRKQLEEELQESEKKLKDIIHYSPVPQFVIDADHKVVYWNKALEAQSNFNINEIVGTKKQWKAFYKEKRPCMADLLVDSRFDDIPHYFNNKYKKSRILDDACEAIDFFPSIGEKGSWLHLTAAAIRNSKGEIIGAVETLQDISEQKDAEEEIRKSLKEKEVLLREIHHRVKNNLQIISSLINLQSNHLEDPKTSETFREIQNRVKSIALLHEKLYQSDDISKINLADYIPHIALDLYKSYGVSSNIKLDMDVDDVYLDINKALPCGLIINELLTNSIKHAFPADTVRGQKNGTLTSSKEKSNSDNGIIHISLHENGDICQMTVCDNGIGYPDDMDIDKIDTLGLRLVDGLRAQLNGQIEIKTQNGAFFKLTFKE